MKFFLKVHKWLGLLLAFFLIVFSLSGIFLNHRQGIAKLDIPRSVLPDSYKYENWNNSAVKGTFKLGPDSILLYGGSGVWLTDSLHSGFSSFMEGMLNGADNRNTTNILRTENNDIFAITTFDLYQLNTTANKWDRQTHILGLDERIADITSKGDSLVIITRSHAYISTYPHQNFHKIELLAPSDYRKEVPLFRAIWTLHSGEMFGSIGKLFVDFIGLVFIILSLSGIVVLFFPKVIKRIKLREKRRKFSSFIRGNLRWHNKLGSWFLIFSIIVILSGIFLRPPAMIFIIRDKIKPIPGSVHDTSNPWFEKLRNIRYDKYSKEWFIYTSGGFYSLQELDSKPAAIPKVPLISVMGMTVLEELAPNLWVVGSFNGLYYWERKSGMSVDITQMRPVFLTESRVEGNLIEPQRGVMGGIDVSGYSKDFPNKEIVFSYSKGALTIGKPEAFAQMPDKIKDVNMSLWHVSLEAHVGRIYTPLVNNIMGESYFILFSGIASLIVFIFGYIIYRKRYRKKRKNETTNKDQESL